MHLLQRLLTLQVLKKYGTAGYYQICPTIDVDIYENAGEANDLGITLAAGPTLYSKPPFLGQDPFGAPGIYVNFPGYSIYRGPDGNSLVRQGALSVMAPTPGTSPNGPSNWGNVASFTLSAAAKFRLGLALDSVGSGTYAPNYVTIHNPSTGTVFSAALVPDANTDMVFFDINGEANDAFIIALWQNDPGIGPVALSLITFDLLDVALPTLSIIHSATTVTLTWPMNVNGYTLEASDNLQLPWDVVPGVVDNSVTLPITQPRKFFRLRNP